MPPSTSKAIEYGRKWRFGRNSDGQSNHEGKSVKLAASRSIIVLGTKPENTEYSFIRVLCLFNSAAIPVYRLGENRSFSPIFRRPMVPTSRKEEYVGIAAILPIVRGVMTETDDP